LQKERGCVRRKKRFIKYLGGKGDKGFRKGGKKVALPTPGGITEGVGKGKSMKANLAPEGGRGSSPIGKRGGPCSLWEGRGCPFDTQESHHGAEKKRKNTSSPS